MNRAQIEIDFAVKYLSSRDAFSSLETSVYWPKWNSPWWHILLLKEMGLSGKIPAETIRKLIEEVRKQCLDFFPFRESEVPIGKDPISDVPCHCQLGSLYQILYSCGVNVDKEIPWIRPWFLRYQLPDGGLNCDEAVYLKPSPKSSIVSTLPPLEAILYCTDNAFTEAEIAFLDSGAEYLLKHHFFRVAGDLSKTIDSKWKQICFPRFYEYDFLRGMVFICRWADKFKRTFAREIIEESYGLLSKMIDSENKSPIIGRRSWEGARTYIFDSSRVRTKGHQADSFPLLEMVGIPGKSCEYLQKDVETVLQFCK
ncbi:MAG: hypothetical protein HQM10_11250 [Candidatus Riflebacteria bacterium]|nr:hypothetical protein [Candidatus Riflebacteria bacterium]